MGCASSSNPPPPTAPLTPPSPPQPSVTLPPPPVIPLPDLAATTANLKTPLEIISLASGYALSLKASLSSPNLLPDLLKQVSSLATPTPPALLFQQHLLLSLALPLPTPAPPSTYPPGTLPYLLTLLAKPTSSFSSQLACFCASDLIHLTTITLTHCLANDLSLLPLLSALLRIKPPLALAPTCVLQLNRLALSSPSLLHSLCSSGRADPSLLFSQPNSSQALQSLSIFASYSPLPRDVLFQPALVAMTKAAFAFKAAPSKPNKHALVVLRSALPFIPPVFAAFADLYELLDEAELHLLSSALATLPQLLQAASAPPDDSSWTLTPDLVAALLTKALLHESSLVRKLVLGRVCACSPSLPPPLFAHIIPALDSKDLYSHSMLQAMGLKIDLAEASVGNHGGKQGRAERVSQSKTDVDGFDLFEGLFVLVRNTLQTRDPASLVPLFIARASQLSNLSGSLCAFQALSRALYATSAPIQPSSSLHDALKSVLTRFTLSHKHSRCEHLILHLAYIATRTLAPSLALALVASHVPPYLTSPRCTALVHSLSLAQHLAPLTQHPTSDLASQALVLSLMPPDKPLPLALAQSEASLPLVLLLLARSPDLVLPPDYAASFTAPLPLALLASPRLPPSCRPRALAMLREAVAQSRLETVEALAKHFALEETRPLVETLLTARFQGPDNARRFALLRPWTADAQLGPRIAALARRAFEDGAVRLDALVPAAACLQDPAAMLAPFRTFLDGNNHPPSILEQLLDLLQADAASVIDLLIAHSLAGKSSEPLRMAVTRLARAGGPWEQQSPPPSTLVALLRHHQVDPSEQLEWGFGHVQRSVSSLCASPGEVQPAALVRFACLHLLDRTRHKSQALCLRLLEDLSTPAAHNDEARKLRDIHDAQAVVVCIRGLNGERAVDLLVKALQRPNLSAEVRFHLEACLALQACRDFSLVAPKFVSLLSQPDANALVVGSVLIAACQAWKRTRADAAVVGPLKRAVVGWIVCSKSIVRAMALVLFERCGEVCANECGDCRAILSGLDRRTRVLLDKIAHELDEKDPEATCSLDTLLRDSVPSLLGELCVGDLLVDRIATHVREYMKQFYDEFGGSGRQRDEEDDEAAAMDVSVDKFHQRKVDVEDTDKDKFGDARQGLVVVASLVDKVPNLGGLARTCEVWRARTLVLADTRVMHDPIFKSLSRTSEMWLPIAQAKPGFEMIQYLVRLKKEEGYIIVGLEQTLESIALQDFTWPEHGRVCLVLGTEKKGIPAEVMGCLDYTVEIPQLGLVRSLNVHVSAACFVWEYTRQQLLEGP